MDKLTDRELDLIYRDKRISRKIKSDVLKKRVEKDGRDPKQIDKAAKVPPGTTALLMSGGIFDKAAVWIVERIRLTLRPQLRARYLYCKPDDADDYDWLTDEQKRSKRIYDAVWNLCENYSLQEVKDALHEIDGLFTYYFEKGGFNIQEVFEDEMQSTVTINYDGMEE